jgi:hypothetical protein
LPRFLFKQGKYKGLANMKLRNFELQEVQLI